MTAIQTEIETMFQEVPESKPLMRQTSYSNYDRRVFESDAWIFAGTNNDSTAITEDLYSKMDASHSDKFYSYKICQSLKRAYPLNYGDVGGDALDRKFAGERVTTTEIVKNPKWLNDNDRSDCDSQGNYPVIKKNPKTRVCGQLHRQILEDCTFSNGTVRVPQQTPPGTVSTPSHYRAESISKFANVTLSQGAALGRIYCELGFDFKTAKRLNKIIRRRKVKSPWDIPVNHDGLTLLELTREIKAVRTADQEAPDWMHYDDGIFQFDMIDDLAVDSIDELDLSEDFDPLASKPGEFTYWNSSTIQVSESARGSKTYKKFLKILSAVWNKSIKKENLAKLSKHVKKLSVAQRVEVRSALRQQYTT